MRVAVIPARGGSKRIPRKNIRDFAGKPIIAYSIDCAKQSGLFDRIIVSTDDEEIADVATRFGVYYQPGEVAEDGSYDLDHTASLMGIDTDGNLRIVWPPGIEPEALAADLEELLK